MLRQRKKAMVFLFCFTLITFVAMSGIALAFSFMGVINDDGVNLRSTPQTNTDSNIIAVLNQGEVVQVIGESPNGRFWEVKLSSSGRHGWVFRKFVSPRE